MALNNKQKLYLFNNWWLKLDNEEQFKKLFLTRAELKAEVQPILEARKAELETNKTTLNQEFLNQEIAKLDGEIQEADDVITNL